MTGFDRIAPIYDLLAAFFSFNNIWRSQSHFISDLKRSSSVLILGGGTGRMLEELNRHGILERCVYVELSAKMIERAKGRQGEGERVHFILGSWDQIPVEKFDVVVTPYVLDCFDENELRNVMNALSERLLTNGQWLFTDFRKDNFLTRMLYFFFRMLGAFKGKRLPDIEKQFSRLGYKAEKEKYFFFRQLVSRVYSRQ